MLYRARWSVTLLIVLLVGIVIAASGEARAEGQGKSAPVPAVAVHPQTQPQTGWLLASGTDFTPGGDVILHLWDVTADQEYLSIPVRVADDGTYLHEYRTSCSTPPGLYDYWAEDNTTGVETARVSFLITPHPTCAFGVPPAPCSMDFGALIDDGDLLPGDIILTGNHIQNGLSETEAQVWLAYGGRWQHAALYIGNRQVIDVSRYGVQIVPLGDVVGDHQYCGAFRVEGDYGEDAAEAALRYANPARPYNPHLLNIWNTTWGFFADRSILDRQRTGDFYSPSLIWRAYMDASGGAIDLDGDLGTIKQVNALLAGLIVPDDLVYHGTVRQIASDPPPATWGWSLFGPADVLITDGQGRRAGVTPGGEIVNEIPGAVFDMHTHPRYVILMEANADSGPQPFDVTLTGSAYGSYTLVLAYHTARGLATVEASGSIQAGGQHVYAVTPSDGDDSPALVAIQVAEPPSAAAAAGPVEAVGDAGEAIAEAGESGQVTESTEEADAETETDNASEGTNWLTVGVIGSVVILGSGGLGAALAVRRRQAIRWQRITREPEQVSPDKIRPVTAWGVEQIRRGETHGGFKTLMYVVKKSPRDEQAWLWLGYAALKLGKYNIAQRSLLNAQKLGHPQAARYLNDLKWIQRIRYQR